MAKKSAATGDRSVRVGRDVVASVIATGDHNKASVHYERITLPPPATINIQEELAKLRKSLGALKSEDSTKVQNAVGDAESELKKPKPDKAEVGSAIERAMKYAKAAVGFGDQVEKLKPQIVNVAAWLGSNWHSLLGYVGLSV